eukprot:scaffold208073_cov17-Prasinocladus_malaysianus.AAC.1
MKIRDRFDARRRLLSYETRLYSVFRSFARRKQKAIFRSRDGRNLMVELASRGVDLAETFEFVALNIRCPSMSSFSTDAAFQTWPRGGGLVHVDATLAESV